MKRDAHKTLQVHWNSSLAIFENYTNPHFNFHILKNQSVDPYFLVTCIWKPENWLTSYYKCSKHLLLQIPIKSLGTTNHHFSCCKIIPLMQFQIKDLQDYLHIIFLELLAVNWVIHKFMCKGSRRDKWPILIAFEKTS